DFVANGDIEWDAIAVIVDPARAHGDDFPLLRLFLGGVRDHEPGRCGLLCFDRLDDYPVFERLMVTDTCRPPLSTVNVVDTGVACRRGEHSCQLALTGDECQSQSNTLLALAPSEC